MIDKEYKYTISVLVMTYNSDWKKTKLTLASILMQKNISIQIVVSDDGSDNNNYDKIKACFYDNKFDDFVLLDNKENVGTVKNVIRAINVAKGKYVKLISPGDVLVGENLLHSWCEFLCSSGKRWSFGNALYTQECLENPLKLVARTQMPRNIDGYVTENTIVAKYNCVIKFDKPHGVSAIMERELNREYLIELSNYIKYSEDYVFVLLVLDDVMPAYYNKNVVIYECDTGISSKYNSKWKQIYLLEKQNIINCIKCKDNYIKLSNELENVNINDYIVNKNNIVSGLNLDECELSPDIYISCVEKQLSQIKAKKTSKSIWIYGAGRWGRLVGKVLQDNGIEVAGYIDKNYKEIQYIDDKVVVDIESVPVEGTFIIISLIEYDFLLEILTKQYGFSSCNLFTIDVTNTIKKKILFIIWSFTYGGGAESLLASIVNKLDKEKYDISIVEFENSTHKLKVDPRVKELPPVNRIYSLDNSSKYDQLIQFPDEYINKYIPGDYDLYISFNYQIPTFLLPYGKKCISWIHGDIYDLYDKPRDMVLQNEAFYKANNIVVISDNTEQSVRNIYPNHASKIKKIYNGIDIKYIQAKAEENSVTLEQPAIIFVGRLDRNKNPMRALDIFCLLKKKTDKPHMYFLGEGELRATLESEIKKRGLKNEVHILGFLDNPMPIIKQAKVQLHVSYSEGFQMTLMEALALGTPFVSTDVGGARLFANNGKCGSIIETDEQATKELEKWLDVDACDAEKWCKESAVRFDMDNYISQIEEEIDAVLDNNAPLYSEENSKVSDFIRGIINEPITAENRKKYESILETYDNDMSVSFLKTIFEEKCEEIISEHYGCIQIDIRLQRLADYIREIYKLYGDLIDKIESKKKIVIICAGVMAERFYRYFISGKTDYFFGIADNNPDIWNTEWHKQQIKNIEFYAENNDNYLYVICNEKHSDDLYMQLIGLNINEDDITFYKG